MCTVKFWSHVIDPLDPEFLRVDGTAERVSLGYISEPKRYEMIGDRRYSVYTFESRAKAIEFIRTPEHMESMRRAREFYHDWDVIREGG